MVLRFGRSLFRKIVQNKLDIFVHINIDTVNCFNELKMTVPLSIMILLAAIILMLYKEPRRYSFGECLYRACRILLREMFLWTQIYFH